MPNTRRIAAALAASALVLAACSNESAADESSPSVSEAPTTEAPVEEPTPEAPADAVEPLISDEGMPAIVDEDGIVTLDFDGATEPDELQVAVIEEGDGPLVTREDHVFVNYAGMVWGSDETFDSSYERGEMASFPLGSVVQGWRDGLQGQKVGSRVIVSVPSELGYGPMGGNETAGIGPDDTIVFVVDILQSVSPDATGDPNASEVTPADELPVTIDGALGEVPSIAVKDGIDEPEDISSVVVAKSDGDPVGGPGTIVYIQYAAATWDNEQAESTADYGGVQDRTIGDGAVFDELQGVPVGSRVLILVPGSETEPALAALVDIVGQLEVPADKE